MDESINKSLPDELNQPKSSPTARSNKKSEKPNKAQTQIQPPKNPGLGFFLKIGFLNPAGTEPLGTAAAGFL